MSHEAADMQDIAESLWRLEQAGYREHFDIRDDKLVCPTAEFDVEHLELVDTIAVDSGTDPGDDATIYVVRTDTGIRGYFVVPGSFHLDTERARMVDRLLHGRPGHTANGT
jgi:hypothetical protein